MKSNQTIDAAISHIQQIVLQECMRGVHDLCEKIVDDVRQRISVPVEHLPNGEVLRSSPGEPPRLDTGALYDNVRYQVDGIDGGEINASVISARPGFPADVAERLEFGLDHEARPYMTPAALAAQEYAAEIIAEALDE